MSLFGYNIIDLQIMYSNTEDEFKKFLIKKVIDSKVYFLNKKNQEEQRQLEEQQISESKKITDNLNEQKNEQKNEEDINNLLDSIIDKTDSINKSNDDKLMDRLNTESEFRKTKQNKIIDKINYTDDDNSSIDSEHVSYKKFNTQSTISKF